MENRSHWNVSTRLNHPKKIKLAPGNEPLLQPVYHSAKFVPAEGFSYWDQYIYSRISNPTTRQLEESLAELQKKEDCILFSSGIAAISISFLALLKEGDHIITFQELYKPARQFIREVLPKFNIEYTVLSLNRPEELAGAIRPNTRIIHFESPSNPNLHLADIQNIIDTCKRHHVLVSMDGTFGGLHQHTSFDIDLMIHSLTKFANGHGDVISGSVAGRVELIRKIRHFSIYMGASLDPQAAYLIQRGLKTYMLRFERQTSTALKIAEFLEKHPHVKNTRYPGLSSYPQIKLAQSQMEDMGSIISFDVDPVIGTADQFCHRLELIQLAASLGSTESIICPVDVFFTQDLTEQEKSEIGLNKQTVRLSIGLEHSEDLISDLSTALG